MNGPGKYLLLALCLGGCSSPKAQGPSPTPLDCEVSCQGCCTADGRCQPGTAPGECGTGGATCQACPEGASCQPQGRCTPVPTVGKACQDASACQALGPLALCQRTTQSGGAEIPQGYCTLPCQGASDCPEKALCVALERGQPSLCLSACDPAQPCRPGYVCRRVGLGQKGSACWLTVRPVADAGPPSPDGLMGAPCDEDADCLVQPPTYGPEDGFCLQAADAGLLAGSCSAPCADDAHCVDGGVCVGYLVAPGRAVSVCQARCQLPLQPCRPGYRCVGLALPLSDGGQGLLPHGVCEP